MRIRLHNIGPIRDAELDLADLTVLVGPNGSGKTTFTTVLYALLLAHDQAVDEALQIVDNPFVRSAKRGSDLTQTLVSTWEESFRRRLEFELRRCCAPDLADLARARRGGKGSGPRIELSSDAWCLPFRLVGDTIEIERTSSRYRMPQVEVPDDVGYVAARQLVEATIRGGLPERAIYFPAGRSGLVHMQAAFSALMAGAMTGGYFQDATVGKIPGATGDFMRLVAQTSPRERSSHTIDAALWIERHLLHGDVRLDDDGATRLVFFAPEGHTREWPVQNMATAVAELTPLVLYLKHSARQGDCVLIDEPESHLHPESQVTLAEALVLLSSVLSPLVVATHSEFLVSALSNVLLRRASANGGSGGQATTVDLAVHQFGFHDDDDLGHGVDVEQIPVVGSEGFEITQFSQVADRVFDESIKLYNRLHAPG